jgi:hypothetical protein
MRTRNTHCSRLSVEAWSKWSPQCLDTAANPRPTFQNYHFMASIDQRLSANQSGHTGPDNYDSGPIGTGQPCLCQPQQLIISPANW